MTESKNIPQHIAVIMDGNGRWAQKRHLPRTVGHTRGASVVRSILESCAQKGVKYLTLFAFSTENWKRPVDEVAILMNLFMEYLEKEISTMQKENIKFKVIGNIKDFSVELQQRIHNTELITANNSGICLVVAANYGGRWDIIQAFNNWRKNNKKENVQLTSEILDSYLCTSGIPDPDLIIRTGGERRISNFLLWQCAYSEIYFTDILWPDFNQEELIHAIDWFESRNRRFGEIKLAS